MFDVLKLNKTANKFQDVKLKLEMSPDDQYTVEIYTDGFWKKRINKWDIQEVNYILQSPESEDEFFIHVNGFE